MLTGIDIAGLVLGSLPLLIEGLKSYQEGLGSLKRSIRYDLSLKKLIRRVNEQKICLEDNIQILLQAACSKSSIYPGVGNEYWSELFNGSTGQAVKEYLGEKKYELFEDLLEEFENCLVKLANDLNRVQRLDKKESKNDHLTLSDIYSIAMSHKTHGKHIIKRVKYLIKEDDIKELTSELDGLNSSMNRLLANTNILHQQINTQESRIIPDEREAMAIASLLKQIRTFTDRLFQAFHATWVSSCHPFHDVALFLDTPTFPANGISRSKPSSFKFRVMLNGKSLDVSMSSPWHEANVTVFEEDNSISKSSQTAVLSAITGGQTIPSIKVTPSVTPSVASSITASVTTSRTSSLISSGKSSIASSVMSSVTKSITHSVPLSTSISASITSQITHNEVENLCDIVTSARKAQKCLDLLLRCERSLLWNDLNLCQPCESFTTLDLLNLKQLLSIKRRIYPNQKVKLAFKLATSLLQLKTSQWFQMSWSSNTIHFRKINLPKDSYHVEMDQPLVLQSFSDTNQSQSQNLEHKPKLMFLELGILLLEIWNEKSFETFAKEHSQIENIPPLMRQGLANEWYDCTYEKMTTRYGKVVQTCVNFAFEYNQGQQSWDDEDLRKSVCAKIIGPLHKECDVFPNK